MMNKLMLILLAGFLMLCGSFQPLKASEGIAFHMKQEVTVYVTNTGSKYHRDSCAYLSKSKISIPKKKAVASGYGACSKCRP